MKKYERKQKKFPYQLIKWMKQRKDLRVYIEQFKKYDDEGYGIIVHDKKRGWTIFTKGQRIITTVNLERTPTKKGNYESDRSNYLLS